MGRAGKAVVGALAGLGAAVSIGGVQAAWGAWALREAGGADPTQKARILAQNISATMNSTAFAALILVPLGAVIGFRRGRKKAE